MQYRLRTLLMLLAVGPMVLAGAWWNRDSFAKLLAAIPVLSEACYVLACLAMVLATPVIGIYLVTQVADAVMGKDGPDRP